MVNDDLLKQIKYCASDGNDSIFISYESESLDFVLKLSNFLERNGIKTWYAPRNIEFFGLWESKLVEAIENCKGLLLIFTERADNSKHVAREITIADQCNKPLLWLKLESSNPKSKVLKYYLSTVQTVLFRDEKSILNGLINSLSEKVLTNETFNYNFKIENEEKGDLKINDWPKKIFAFQNEDEAAECAARVYFLEAISNPDKTALLPTGRSAKRIFQAMIRIAIQEYNTNPFGDSYIMNDTETFGVGPKHNTSRINSINSNLIDILKICNKAPSDEKITFFGGIDSNIEPEEKCAIHLQRHPVSVFGISVSPYTEIIGYELGNEDKNIINDGPRVIDVSENTRKYIDEKQKSKSIYTVGLKTAINAETLMILAFESNKSNAINCILREGEDISIPASLLRRNKNAYLIITKDIANKIGLKNHAITNLTPKEAALCITKK